MFNFTSKTIKLLVVVALFIIVIILILLAYASREKNADTAGDNASNEAQYGFLESEISEKDKYIMLLAKIQVENFGTNPSYDPRPLWDLKNQSTQKFGAIVDGILDNPPANKEEIITSVDPDSIKISNAGIGRVDLTMEATQTLGSETTRVKFQVFFLKEDQFWLVNNIIQL